MGGISFLRTTGLLRIVATCGALVALYLLVALAFGRAPLIVASGFAFGLVVWTFMEYVKHRFLDHEEEGHMEHHRSPLTEIRIRKGTEQARTIARNFLLLTAPSIVGAFLVGPWAFAAVLATAAGVLAGYAAYRTVHVACHELPMSNPWAARLKRHHAIHHYRDENRNYGITTSLWDHVFRTAWRPDTQSAGSRPDERGLA